MINNPEVLYAQGTAAVWSAVEINIGILCNCLAMLKPFVRRHLPWLRSRIGAGSHQKAAAPAGGVGGKTTHAHRDSSGNYELHSYGRDVVVRGGFHSGKAKAGRRRHSDSGSDGDTLGPKGLGVARHHGGILVTTTVAMGRSSEGDVSTDDILGRGRGENFSVLSPAARDGSP